MSDSPTKWYVEVSREASREVFSSPHPLIQRRNEVRNPPRWRYRVAYPGNVEPPWSDGWYGTEQGARAAGEAKARALYVDPNSDRASQAQKRQAPPPSENMPEEIRAVYEDAMRVDAARSANALLRIACEDLCRIKGVPGGNFRSMITNLRKREDISSMLGDAIDAIRITGNVAVHETDHDTPVEKLFNLVNIIADEWPKANEVASVYDPLPDEKKVPRSSRDRAQ